MIYIFGNHHFVHHRGRVNDSFICPHCCREMNFVLQTTASWFTLFFIPIFPYRFQRQVVCPCCGCQLKMSGPEYDELLKNRKRDKIRKL